MKNTEIYIYLLCSVIFFCIIQTKRIKEGLQDNNFVVLIGDSIFQNKGYVQDKHTIEYRLKNKINSMVLAKDDSRIIDIFSQYKEIPKDLNETNTYLFISIGGNDLLYEYQEKGEHIEDLSAFNKVWENYVREINKIINRTSCTVVLTDIYYVYNKTYHKYYNIIDAWNKNLERFCKEKNILLYQISNLVKRRKDFVNNIEPSKYGSEIIANNIVNF